MSDIGSRIRKLRLAQDLKQEAISSERVSVSYISRIETGDIAYPSMEALVAIAEKLGTTAHSLELGDDASLVECPYCGRT